MRQEYIVGFFEDRQGNRPVEQYLFQEKNLTDLVTMINVIQRLAIVGQDLLDTKMAKHLEGPIFELRKDRHRILYAPDGKRFVLLSAFLKKTQKTPAEEVDLAQERFAEYQDTGRFYELKLPPL